MLPGYDGITQGVLGTVFTWFVTALGAAVVFVIPTMSEAVSIPKTIKPLC